MLKIKESLLKKLIREAIHNYDNNIIYVAIKFVKEFNKKEIFDEDGSLNFLDQKFERLDPRGEIFSKNEWNIFDSATKALEDHEKQLEEVCIQTKLVCDMTDRTIQDIEILEISVGEYHFPMNGFSMMEEIPGISDVLKAKQEEAFKIFNEKPLVNGIIPGTKILAPLQYQKINDLFEENIFDLYDMEVMISTFDARFEIFRRMELSVKNLNYLDCPFAVGLHRVVDIYEFHEFLKSIGFIAQYNNIRNTIYNKYMLENGNMNLEFEYDWNDPPAPPSIDPKKPNLSIGTAKIESIDIKEDNMKEFSYTARNTIRAIIKIAERYDLGD